MAIYRLHRKEWEHGDRPLGVKEVTPKKRRRGSPDKSGGMPRNVKVPDGGRKGISSGLSTVVNRGRSSNEDKTKWWKELDTGSFQLTTD